MDLEAAASSSAARKVLRLRGVSRGMGHQWGARMAGPLVQGLASLLDVVMDVRDDGNWGWLYSAKPSRSSGNYDVLGGPYDEVGLALKAESGTLACLEDDGAGMRGECAQSLVGLCGGLRGVFARRQVKW